MSGLIASQALLRLRQHSVVWPCQRIRSVQMMALLWLAETVLVFTKEAFHVLTSAGKKGA